MAQPTSQPTTRQPSVPRPRGVVATLAAARGLMSDPCPTLDALGAELGPTFEIRVGPLRMIVVGDPDHLTELYATPSDAFRWGYRMNPLRFVVGDGSMIVADGDDHRRRRGAVQPGFARRRLERWVPMIVEEADRTIDAEILPSPGVTDLFPIGRRLALRVVVNALFGQAFRDRAQEIDGILEPVKTYLEQPALRHLPHPLPFTRRARARDARDRFDRIIDAEIARRRAEPQPDSADVLDLLLTAGGMPDGLSDAEIRDQVVSLVAAGYDTTASSLAWTLLRAAGTDGIWSRVREEADHVLGSTEPGPSSLTDLVFARAVVREALRLHPAGVFAPRQAARDLTLGRYAIGRSSYVLACPHLAGRDERTWADAMRFDPDRHLDPDTGEPTVPGPGWIPFGRGPRHCIGFALAEMELTLVLARFAQRLDLHLESSEVPASYGMIVNRPEGGVRTTARARAARPSRD